MRSKELHGLKSIKDHSDKAEIGTVTKYIESPDKVTSYKF